MRVKQGYGAKFCHFMAKILPLPQLLYSFQYISRFCTQAIVRYTVAMQLSIHWNVNRSKLIHVNVVIV